MVCTNRGEGAKYFLNRLSNDYFPERILPQCSQEISVFLTLLSLVSSFSELSVISTSFCDTVEESSGKPSGIKKPEAPKFMLDLAEFEVSL